MREDRVRNQILLYYICARIGYVIKYYYNYKQTVVADQFDRQNLFSADQSWIFPDHNFSNPDPLPP